MLGIRALTFDTGGTILDWHTGISRPLAKVGVRHGLERDWGAITNDYRASSLKAMINAVLIAGVNGQINFSQHVHVFGLFILQPLDAALGVPGN